MTTMADVHGKLYNWINLLTFFPIFGGIGFIVAFQKYHNRGDKIAKFAPIVSFIEVMVSAFIMGEVFVIGLDNLWATSAVGKFIMLVISIAIFIFWYSAYNLFSAYADSKLPPEEQVRRRAKPTKIQVILADRKAKKEAEGQDAIRKARLESLKKKDNQE